jgi:hypothetical protein
VLLVVLLALLGGGGFLGWTLWTGRDGGSSAAGSTTERTRTEVPELERVVPSLASVRTPTPPTSTVAAEASAPEPTPADPQPGSPCSDDMIDLAVRAPASVAAGSTPTFELVVTNTSAVPCQRALDKGLQELVLLDGGGTRVWGSNDCFPEASSDTRTLAPGEVVVFPVVWGGLTSEPTCTAARTPPAPGNYVLRGRLDTKTSADTAITLG